MPRYLALALLREGTTDDRFLSELLHRAVQEICLQNAREVIDIGPIQDLRRFPIEKPIDTERLIEFALLEKDSYHVLFVHADGNGDPEGARKYRVNPIVEALARNQGKSHSHSVIAVVPVRELEAWALADGDALRSAFCCRLPDSELKVPSRPEMVELIDDPKAALDASCRSAFGGRRSRRRRQRAAPFLAGIGGSISLTKLRKVPAFYRMEVELHSALVALSFIPSNLSS